METLRIRFTRGDHATVCGGIVLRKRTHKMGSHDTDEYIVHRFARDRGSQTPTSFFHGQYIFDDIVKANAAFDKRVDDAKQWTTGGSLIPDDQLAKELAAELERAAA